MDELVKTHALVNSIIGEGTRFRGDVEIAGLLRIDGDFEGSINASGRVLIGRNGRAKCLIAADTVVVGGVVLGDIKASSKIVLLSTCVVIGNISSPLLVVEEGVLLNGYCTVSRDERVLASAPAGDDGVFSVDWGKTSPGF
ncbi:MAG: hypothetical protein CSA76_03215 [Spirochaetales bacterium]|nr:MAG: hypothetical protein CSA76_03215 [Spirochaetales bacterium]